MNTPKAIVPPKPPKIARLESEDALPDEPVFDGLHILDVLDFPDYDVDDVWHIDGCKFERSMLAGRAFRSFKIWDSILVSTDISACKAFEAGLLRSEFLGCRMSGAQFGESTIQDVTFQNCKLNLLSFRKCRLERVVFQNCMLDEADFIGATLSDVVFVNCEMTKTDFNRARCTRVDMTRSDMSGVRGVMSLKGVRIKPEQMMDIAPLLCAEVGFVLE